MSVFYILRKYDISGHVNDIRKYYNNSVIMMNITNCDNKLLK